MNTLGPLILILVPILIVIALGVFTVKQQQMAIIERFGKLGNSPVNQVKSITSSKSIIFFLNKFAPAAISSSFLFLNLN